MSEEDSLALIVLIERLDRTPALTEVEIFTKRRARTPSFINQSKEEIAATIERSKRTAPLAPARHTFPGFGNPNHDLGLHTGIVSAQFDDWFSWAHDPPPHSINRILAITKRAKMLSIRDRFEDQVSRHLASLNKPRVPREPSGDPTVDYLHSKLPRLGVAVKDITHQGGTSYFFNFEFCCLDCGGFILSTPDNDDFGPVVCKACQQVFGNYWDLKELANAIGKHELERRGL
ncbi:hypothetical protein ACWKW5_07720 [Shinella zoogloeoides]